MPAIAYVSSLGSFSGDPRGFRATLDAYRQWPPMPGPPTKYLTLGALFRRRQYLEGEALVAGNWEPDNAGYGLFVDEERVLFRFGLRSIADGSITPVTALYVLPKPRLRKWLCVLAQVVYQNTDTTIYLQVNGEVVATSQLQYAAGAMEYAVPSGLARFSIGTDENLPAPFQLDISGVGVSLSGAVALDVMGDWYDIVRQGGELVSPSEVGMPPFQSMWIANSFLPPTIPPSATWDDEMDSVPLTNIGYSDIERPTDTAPVML